MFRVSHLLGKALRETGQAIDRVGLTISGNELFKETFSRHRNVMNLFDKRPSIAAGGFVAPNAAVIGNVLLKNNVSIWYGAVIRGDKNMVRIGNFTNVQDRAIISTVSKVDSGFPSDVEIGDKVTIGHGAILTSCTVGDQSMIGQGAIVSEGSDIGSNTIIAAGAIVLPNTKVPSGQLWAGNPAAYVRDVTAEELDYLGKSANTYDKLAQEHAEEFLPFGTVYQEAEKL